MNIIENKSGKKILTYGDLVPDNVYPAESVNALIQESPDTVWKVPDSPGTTYDKIYNGYGAYANKEVRLYIKFSPIISVTNGSMLLIPFGCNTISPGSRVYIDNPGVGWFRYRIWIFSAASVSADLVTWNNPPGGLHTLDYTITSSNLSFPFYLRYLTFSGISEHCVCLPIEGAIWPACFLVRVDFEWPITSGYIQLGLNNFRHNKPYIIDSSVIS